MKIIDFSTGNTILNQFLAELRDVTIQQDSLRFRRNIERIGEIMAYEISRDLPYTAKEIQTPLAHAIENVPAVRPVIATILRAGLPLHRGFINYFDRAENAFVSAYRKYFDEDHFDIHIEYIASPNLNGKTLVLTDTMLATGASMEYAYEALLTKGTPAHIHIASDTDTYRHDACYGGVYGICLRSFADQRDSRSYPHRFGDSQPPSCRAYPKGFS